MKIVIKMNKIENFQKSFKKYSNIAKIKKKKQKIKQNNSKKFWKN